MTFSPIRVTAAVASVLVIAACGSAPQSPGVPAVTAPSVRTVSSVALSTFDGKFRWGMAPTEVVQLSAKVTYSDGTTDSVTTQASWTSQTPGLVMVTPTGRATGLAAGVARVRVEYGGASTESNISINAIESIEIDTRHVEPSLQAGQTAELRALYHLTGGFAWEVTDASDWRVNGNAATVTGSGVATGRAEGIATVSATFGGVTGSAEIWVTRPGCTYAVTPTSITPDQNLMVTHNGFPIQVTAPAGCAWRTSSLSDDWEIRSSAYGDPVTTGTGADRLFLACRAAAENCRQRIAQFVVAGSRVTKWSAR